MIRFINGRPCKKLPPHSRRSTSEQPYPLHCTVFSVSSFCIWLNVGVAYIQQLDGETVMAAVVLDTEMISRSSTLEEWNRVRSLGNTETVLTYHVAHSSSTFPPNVYTEEQSIVITCTHLEVYSNRSTTTQGAPAGEPEISVNTCSSTSPKSCLKLLNLVTFRVASDHTRYLRPLRKGAGAGKAGEYNLFTEARRLLCPPCEGSEQMDTFSLFQDEEVTVAPTSASSQVLTITSSRPAHMNSYNCIAAVVKRAGEQHAKTSITLLEIDDEPTETMADKRLLKVDVTLPSGVITMRFRRCHREDRTDQYINVLISIKAGAQISGSVYDADVRIHFDDEARISDPDKPDCIREIWRIISMAEMLLAV